MSGVTGTSSQRRALYLDIIGHCRDQPVASLTDTMSDTNYSNIDFWVIHRCFDHEKAQKQQPFRTISQVYVIVID